MQSNAAIPQARWTLDEAWRWYRRQPWLVGCNFLPSTAINQLEMWQEETFDPETIDQELSWAAGLGFNTVRTYLHDLVWTADREGFLARIDRFLGIAFSHGIRPMLVFFDDCHYSQPHLGPQPEPIPGVHNSGWKQSPGGEIVERFHDDSVGDETRARLREYVQEVIGRFAADERVLMWDLYNEPGQRRLSDRSVELLTEVFRWAQKADPAQPLTVGLNDMERHGVNEVMLTASDITTFHHYWHTQALEEMIAWLQERNDGRPLICTEYMARPMSYFQTHLPVFGAHGIGALNWGLVAGRSNTIWPWSSRTSEIGPREQNPTVPPEEVAGEPDPWFHDIFRPDGTPYDPAETEFLRQFIADTRREGAADGRG